jgi:hypothetical protein
MSLKKRFWGVYRFGNPVRRRVIRVIPGEKLSPPMGVRWVELGGDSDGAV